ncbi:MAG: radical SAM protein [Dehalococcoidia bacterium]|nr:Antilisterial bacteriocin subtilosin biosynthesis protein AlbA [Chloroflexota bacterium]MBT9160842.1 Antilisterial bacteriocin subtilosin biosynthesis protein AlbA [Chloroflexota bacterium]MBT9162669.1 Antilisterial bacteriocin subtilosin biosynthesis protein AlbA [Chloroflexota bacterium]
MLRRWAEKFRLVSHFDKKFSLNEDVYLVKGSKRGAIYDLAGGDVYSVDETFSNALDSALLGRTPKEITMEVDHNLYEIIGFLRKLADQGLGEWYEGPTHSSKSYKDLPPPSWHLRFAWLELTDSCNLRCVHCYSDSGASQLPEKGTMLTEDFRHLILEVAGLGCSAIQFTGGEALLRQDQLLDLILIAEEKGIEVEVFTNLTLLTKGIVNFFKQHNVRVGTSLYASNQQLHDSITRVKGSFVRTIESIRELVSADIPLRVGIVAMPQNENSLNQTIRFAKEELGVHQVRASKVLRVGRGCSIASDDFIPLGEKLAFPKISKEDFIARLHGHNCWRGKIAIAPTGEVLPCPAARDIVLGNVQHQNLPDIIVSDRLRHIWELSKDKIESCQDCEYRYACFDCRPRAENLTSKPTDCWYNLCEC